MAAVPPPLGRFDLGGRGDLVIPLVFNKGRQKEMCSMPDNERKASDKIYMRNTPDGWHECVCDNCSEVYRLPKNPEGGLTLRRFTALIKEFADLHEKCNENEVS